MSSVDVNAVRGAISFPTGNENTAGLSENKKPAISNFEPNGESNVLNTKQNANDRKVVGNSDTCIVPLAKNSNNFFNYNMNNIYYLFIMLF